MQWPRDTDTELDAFYGRPDGSARWEVTHLTYIFPPWRCYLAGTNVELKNGIRVHKKVAASLEAVFASLWETFGKSQSAVEAVDLHQIGGAYFFRARRGSKRLSNHARGIAIDIDPQDNQMGRGKPSDMDPRIVAAFEKEGWRWGKAFNDPMHFEAVFNGKPAKPVFTIKPAPSAGVADTTKWITAAIPLITRWEGFRATPYWDVHQWAIGYGQKCEKDHPPITEERAMAMLKAYLVDLVNKVAPLVTVPVTPNQGGALLSFAYNLGHGALAKSKLLKMLNAHDKTGAANEFLKWCKAGGKKLPGLEKRRAAERQLFLTAA